MLRINILDRIPFVGPLINNIVDGTQVVGAGPIPLPAAVETKVVAATVGSTLAEVVMVLLESHLSKLPGPVRWVVRAVAPALVVAIAGYFSPHTARELPATT